MLVPFEVRYALSVAFDVLNTVLVLLEVSVFNTVSVALLVEMEVSVDLLVDVAKEVAAAPVLVSNTVL